MTYAPPKQQTASHSDSTVAPDRFATPAFIPTDKPNESFIVDQNVPKGGKYGPSIIEQIRPHDETNLVQASSEQYAGTDEEGSCAQGVVIVPKNDALLVLILNVLMPGIGSFVAAYRSIDGFNYSCCG